MTKYYHYLYRMLEVAGVFSGLAFRVVYRRLRGQPIQGPQLFRDALQTLSGAFIKLGQLLSLQLDSLPRAYCDALLALLDNVPPFSRAQVERVFLRELNGLPKELYREFNYRTLASASIGQVHRAVLKDGTLAAIKVQRPGIAALFERDNLLLQGFVKLLVLLRLRRFYFLRDSVRELSEWTRDELDFRREAVHCQLLRENAAQIPTERIPKVYWDLTTAHVLTMDYLEGPSVAEYLRLLEEGDETKLALLRAQGFAPSTFVANVTSNFLSDAFQFGAFHADLHPANLLILPGNVVGYVDFGIVAFLSPDARRRLVDLSMAFSRADAAGIYQGLMNICATDEGADLSGMRRQIEKLVRGWYQEPAATGRVRFRVTITKVFLDLLSVCRAHGVFLEREMIRYIRSVFLADGLVTRLAPGLDLAEKLQDAVGAYEVGEVRRKIFSPGSVVSFLTDAVMWLQAGPRAVLRSLELLERTHRRPRRNVSFEPGRAAGLRARTLAAAVVWVFVVLALGIWDSFPSWQVAPVVATLTGVFVALWTAWLIRLLQRLATM